MNIETAEDAIEAWKTHDGWEFADREAAWKWMFAQGRQAGRLDEREECALLCEWLAKDDDVPAGSIADGNECAISIRERAALEPRFANVSCSQCGRDFGPGDHGFSHCENHRDLTPNGPHEDTPPASGGGGLDAVVGRHTHGGNDGNLG